MPLKNSTTPQQNLLSFDREHIWHPYTSALHPLTCYEAVAAHGCRIVLRDGKSLVDGMASWWCAIHGYGHPSLLKALHEQAERMPHVMFGGLTHEPAVTLARKLLHMVPGGFEHVFFADSGSVSVEVALKMALQYQRAAGKPERTAFLTLRGGYHGDTFGAMSVCDPVNGMHGLFGSILARQHFGPRPSITFDGQPGPEVRRELEDGPVLLLLGTAQGLASEVLDECRHILPPLRWADNYNHLPVRAAAAIFLDRLLGDLG